MARSFTRLVGSVKFLREAEGLSNSVILSVSEVSQVKMYVPSPWGEG